MITFFQDFFLLIELLTLDRASLKQFNQGD